MLKITGAICGIEIIHHTCVITVLRKFEFVNFPNSHKNLSWQWKILLTFRICIVFTQHYGFLKSISSVSHIDIKQRALNYIPSTMYIPVYSIQLNCCITFRWKTILTVIINHAMTNWSQNFHEKEKCIRERNVYFFIIVLCCTCNSKYWTLWIEFVFEFKNIIRKFIITSSNCC